MGEYYEAVGKLIYGVQQLDGVLASLSVWLGGQAMDDANAEADLTFDDRAAVASAYFAAHPRQDDVPNAYLKVLQTVRDLDKQCRLLKGEQIDARNFLTELRECHFAIADVIDSLRCPGICTDVLRSRAKQ